MNENRSMRTGQDELANRRIQPLCHLSAVCLQQLTTTALLNLVHSWCTLVHQVYRGLQLLHRCHDGRVKRLDVAILRDVRFCVTQDTLDNILVRAQLIQIRRDARRTATHRKAQGGNATTTSGSALSSADPMQVITKIVSLIDT